MLLLDRQQSQPQLGRRKGSLGARISPAPAEAATIVTVMRLVLKMWPSGAILSMQLHMTGTLMIPTSVGLGRPKGQPAQGAEGSSSSSSDGGRSSQRQLLRSLGSQWTGATWWNR